MNDKIEQFTQSNTREQNVEFAIFYAKLVIDVFENQCPSDNRPRNAINTAKNWLDNPYIG